jgi:hypothetical protein
VAAVEHESCQEPVAQPPLKVTQSAEVVRPGGLAGFDLDADYPPGIVLKDAVDFDLVAIPVVIEPRRRSAA